MSDDDSLTFELSVAFRKRQAPLNDNQGTKVTEKQKELKVNMALGSFGLGIRTALVLHTPFPAPYREA